MSALNDIGKTALSVPQAIGGGALDVLIGDRTNVSGPEQAKRLVQALLLSGDQGQNLLALQHMNAQSDALNQKGVASPEFQGAVATLMRQGVPGDVAFKHVADRYGLSGYAPAYSEPQNVVGAEGFPSQQSRVPLLPPPSAQAQVKYATSQEQLRGISRPGAEGAYALSQLAKINPDLAVQDELLKQATGPYEQAGQTATDITYKNGELAATVKHLGKNDVYFPATDEGRQRAIVAADAYNTLNKATGSAQRMVPAVDPRGGFGLQEVQSQEAAAFETAQGRYRGEHTIPGGGPPSVAPLQRGAVASNYETRLSPSDEAAFQAWKQQYAPNDSGADYDLRGAFKAGLTPSPVNGHWPDTFKKPNHPTFSDQSVYAQGENAARAGHWNGDQYIPSTAAPVQPGAGGPQTVSGAYPRIDALAMTPAEYKQLDAWQKKDLDLKYETATKSYDAKLKGVALSQDQQKRLSQVAASRAWLASWVDLGLNGRQAKDAPEQFPSDLPETARGLGTAQLEGGRQVLEQYARNPFYIEMQRLKSIGLPVLARNMGGDVGNLSEFEQKAAKSVEDARAKDEVKNAAYTMEQILKNREQMIVSGKEDAFNAQQQAVRSVPQPQLGGGPAPTPQATPAPATGFDRAALEAEARKRGLIR